jgi:hypothetical protein
MSKKPTAADAELILKLYDLRREAEMRRARNWWVVEFWPETADDIIKIAMTLGTQENNWLRQVPGYWGIAASLALAGTVDRDLFLEPSFSGEMFLIYAKIKPFLKEVREKMKNPRMFAHIETLINSSKESREFLKHMEGNLANRRKMMAESAKVAKAG